MSFSILARKSKQFHWNNILTTHTFDKYIKATHFLCLFIDEDMIHKTNYTRQKKIEFENEFPQQIKKKKKTTTRNMNRPRKID